MTRTSSILRLVVVLCASVSLLVGSLGVASAKATQSTYVPTAEECQFLGLINDYRAQNGIGPLQLSVTLGDAARNHSAQIAATDFFSHTLPDGTSWADNIRNYGYTYNTWIGENLAAGNYEPSYALLQWQRSPAHNANMLAPEFTAIGIAMVYEPNSSWGYYWTTTFGGYVDQTASC